MISPFSNLESVKQQRILNAALKEFAEHGYENASTNRIVKEARIGKGMLFYYFNNKEALFHYLAHYSMNFVLEEHLAKIDETESDFVERYKQAAQLKWNVHAKHPQVFEFMATQLLNHGTEMSEDNQRLMTEMKELGYKKMYGNIDTSLFREDVDQQTNFKLIRWVMDGYEKELLNRLQGKKITDLDFDLYWSEFYDLLDTIKIIFYK